jgi:YidC/Oxa1 family membrane protein insertase
MNPNSGNEKFSMEARLLVAFLLMSAVLFITPYFYKQQAPPKKDAKAAAQQQPPTPAQTQATAAAANTPPPNTPPPQPGTPVQADKEEFTTVETDLYKVTFSNRGATVRSWVLKKYNDNSGHPVELVNKEAFAKAGPPFALYFPQAPAVDPNTALWQLTRSSDGLAVDFAYSSGQVQFRKTLHFQQKSYVVDVTSEAFQGGTPLVHSIAWRGGFGDNTMYNAYAAQRTVMFDQNKQKLVQQDNKAAANAPIKESGAFAFAGLEDQYFAAVALVNNPSTELTTFSDKVKAPGLNDEQPHIGGAIGGQGRNAFNLFVGPKDLDLLRSINPKLEQIVDWGWFWFLAKPLFKGLNWLNDQVVHNYGWSIVIITALINLALLPLRFSSMRSAKKMSLIQPEIQAINEKYRGISVRDPKKQQQNEEVMALYKRHGVNPLGGCFPMLLQLPVFVAFYKVLTVTIEMRGAHWLWVDDLSRPESLAIRVLPVLMIATQFFLQKMTPAAGMDPSQQRMMLMMPLFLGFMFYYQSSGLVLYWLTGNIVGIIQQWVTNQFSPAPAVVPAPAKANAPRKKGT